MGMRKRSVFEMKLRPKKVPVGKKILDNLFMKWLNFEGLYLTSGTKFALPPQLLSSMTRVMESSTSKSVPFRFRASSLNKDIFWNVKVMLLDMLGSQKRVVLNWNWTRSASHVQQGLHPVWFSYHQRLLCNLRQTGPILALWVFWPRQFTIKISGITWWPYLPDRATKLSVKTCDTDCVISTKITQNI